MHICMQKVYIGTISGFGFDTYGFILVQNGGGNTILLITKAMKIDYSY